MPNQCCGNSGEERQVPAWRIALQSMPKKLSSVGQDEPSAPEGPGYKLHCNRSECEL